MSVVAGYDGKHERTDEEALNLDPATPKYLDEEDGQEVAGHVARRSDDEIPISVLEERVILGFALGETNGRQEHRLVEVQTVKGDIDQEPGGCGAD